VETIIEFEANIFLGYILQIFGKNHDLEQMFVLTEYNFLRQSRPACWLHQELIMWLPKNGQKWS
jgi:hypothetical protein